MKLIRLTTFLLFLSPLFLQAQISVSQQVINYFTVFTDEADSIQVSVTNNSPVTFEATDIELFHGLYSVNDTAFTLSPGASKSLTFKVNARHNLNYMDFALIESTTHPDGVYFQLYASAKYRDSYYDVTQNKSHEELKTALKGLLGFGYMQFTYNTARDKIFMNIDNQAVNGQGAGSNTIECVYTGRTVSGYLTRQEAQNNGNFNTEHSIPQSLFSQNYPMYSDMHHLYATHAPANSERGSKPYGVVSNPSWTDGGSKANASTFEPRDQQKGVAARTLFYFAVRYQDYNGFIASQESILRDWHETFTVTPVDTMRNYLIYQEQNNRNPFIDHPEFADLERMAAIATTNAGPTAPEIHALSDLNFGSTAMGDTAIGYFRISNQGPKDDLLLSNLTLSNTAEFSIVGTPNGTVNPDTLRTIGIRFHPSGANQNYTETLSLSTNDPDHSTWVLALTGNSFPVNRDQNLLNGRLSVYPNPTSGNLLVELEGVNSPTQYQLLGLQGQELMRGELSAGKGSLDLSRFANGLYLLKVSSAEGNGWKKVLVNH